MIKTICTFVAAVSLCLPAHAAQRTGAEQALRIQGQEYASACTVKNQALRQQTLAAQFDKAGIAADAATLVETLLCRKKTGGTQAFITSRMGKRVVRMTSDTGSDDLANQALVTPELVASLQREGAAWDADLIIVPGEITLRYMSNETCVQSRVLRASKGQWRLVQLDEACD